jgi:hypothetical protein
LRKYDRLLKEILSDAIPKRFSFTYKPHKKVNCVEYKGGKIHNEFYATLNSYLNIISTFPLCTES